VTLFLHVLELRSVVFVQLLHLHSIGHYGFQTLQNKSPVITCDDCCAITTRNQRATDLQHPVKVRDGALLLLPRFSQLEKETAIKFVRHVEQRLSRVHAMEEAALYIFVYICSSTSIDRTKRGFEHSTGIGCRCWDVPGARPVLRAVSFEFRQP